ncbi:hypothetical protein CXG81DRAFT_23180 [Caulochytrium protostelioides]|uniref:Transcription elongation factor SPT4 n=1 Tax=Caulochytrium protostelioides TaxID=1555241 RepID=A0A4P9XF74_9FUNG|nr:hypothetical protein CXG81DRAFT_23180 [Caulochytrium protostelioides]|eukprot:RKP04226.1 hypothetical protein CXG81DRAFT_23180 [Caulochytrium protostelioides]
MSASSIVPNETNKRKLRACLMCGLVKTTLAFRAQGCDNCEPLLNTRANSGRALECTSSQFDGVIAVTRPDKSWVARWQRVDQFQKGIYAIRVQGRLPLDVQDELHEQGITYRPRDGSAKD